MPENAGRVKFLSFKIKLYNWLLRDLFYNEQEFLDGHIDITLWFGGDDQVLFDIT